MTQTLSDVTKKQSAWVGKQCCAKHVRGSRLGISESLAMGGFQPRCKATILVQSIKRATEEVEF